MRSKIQISIAEDNHPIIEVTHTHSEDTRDLLVKRFLESFKESSEASFRFTSRQADSISTVAVIRPIRKECQDDGMSVSIIPFIRDAMMATGNYKDVVLKREDGKTILVSSSGQHLAYLPYDAI